MSKVFYKEYGGGYPLIFLHGFCETNYVWTGLAETLQNDFRVLCPDLPGFGKTPLTKNDFSIEDIAREIKGWLTGFGIEKCILIGHSLGGYITLAFVRQFPEMIDGFCLFNSSAYEDSAEKKENRNKLIEHLKENGVESFIKTFVPSLFYADRLEEFDFVLKTIKEEGLKLPAEAVAGYAAAMRDRQGSVDLLKKYSERVLIIAGEEDNNVPKETSLKMSELIDSGNFHLLPATAHMGMFEQQLRSAEIIKDFASSLGIK